MGNVWHSLKVRAMTSDFTITQMYREGERFPTAFKHKKERQVMKANQGNTSGDGKQKVYIYTTIL